MVILHLESKEDWLDVQSYYVSQIHSPLVIWEQLLDNSVSFVVSVLFGAWVCFFNAGISPIEDIPDCSLGPVGI